MTAKIWSILSMDDFEEDQKELFYEVCDVMEAYMFPGESIETHEINFQQSIDKLSPSALLFHISVAIANLKRKREMH